MSEPASLLVDVGNTRIKWARVTGRGRGRQHDAPLSGDGRAVFRGLAAALPHGSRILAVNVAGAAVERALRAAARDAKLAPPRLLRTTAREGALVNGYRDPWRLGADRWAAMLGARALTGGRRPLCVIDIGTAMTVDFVHATGRHHGGYIVPGPTLATLCLLVGTRGIARRAGRAAPAAAVPRDPVSASWPRATLPAIEHGSVEACAAMVLRCAAAARREWGAATRLVLTGGAAPAILRLLPPSAVHAPDLVLQGLQAWDAGGL
jgi:type III pantothenate kinase